MLYLKRFRGGDEKGKLRFCIGECKAKDYKRVLFIVITLLSAKR